ncbi:MAG: ABC transporter permease [Bacillota bacterium]|nr:ABC transporter permease [Bacillota bacterium]MDW7683560.1 ABC transporter permease [Bacillota bacterium]
MTAFVHSISFELQNGLRNKSLLLMNYLFPLGFYFMVGSVMASINPFFTEIMVPAMVIFTVLSGTVISLPNPLVEAREAGILRSYRINGVPSLSVLAIPSLTAGVHLFLVSIIITVTAPVLFDAPQPVNLSAFALCYLVTLFACSGLGQLIGVISANTQVSVLWSQLVYLPSMLIGGLMIPADVLPAGLQKVSQLLPTTHAMQAFNSLAMGSETAVSPWWALLVLFVGGIVAYALAGLLFSWDNKNPGRGRYPLLAVLALLPYVFAAVLLP